MPSHSRGALRPSFARSFLTLMIRGRGEDRVPIAPMGPVQKKHGGRTTGSTGITPAFPAQWFTAYTALSPVTGFLATVAPGKLASRELDASNGASGPHGFAVRVGAVRQKRIRVHRIPPHVRDDRERPSERSGTGRGYRLICNFGKSEYFCKRGLTRGSRGTRSDLPVEADAILSIVLMFH